MTALRQQQPRALSTPRQIARFCCGLNSPLLSQTKLNKHPDFGTLAEVPFQIVLKAAEPVAQQVPDSSPRSPRNPRSAKSNRRQGQA